MWRRLVNKGSWPLRVLKVLRVYSLVFSVFGSLSPHS